MEKFQEFLLNLTQLHSLLSPFLRYLINFLFSFCAFEAPVPGRFAIHGHNPHVNIAGLWHLFHIFEAFSIAR